MLPGAPNECFMEQIKCCMCDDRPACLQIGNIKSKEHPLRYVCAHHVYTTEMALKPKEWTVINSDQYLTTKEQARTWFASIVKEIEHELDSLHQNLQQKHSNHDKHSDSTKHSDRDKQQKNQKHKPTSASNSGQKKDSFTFGAVLQKQQNTPTTESKTTPELPGSYKHRLQTNTRNVSTSSNQNPSYFRMPTREESRKASKFSKRHLTMIDTQNRPLNQASKAQRLNQDANPKDLTTFNVDDFIPTLQGQQIDPTQRTLRATIAARFANALVIDIPDSTLTEDSSTTKLNDPTKSMDDLLAMRAQQETMQAVSKRKVIYELASRIEGALFRFCEEATSNEYAVRARSLLYNMNDKQNIELRTNIRNGVIAPSRLVKMEAYELANEEIAQEREKALQVAIGANNDDDVSIRIPATFRCPVCGENDTEYVPIASRLDIGKTETWGNKETPETIIRVICKACHHSWTREMR